MRCKRSSTTYPVDEIAPTPQLERSIWDMLASVAFETAENDRSDVGDV